MLGPWFVFLVSLACSFVLWKGSQEELMLPLLPSSPECFSPRVGVLQEELAIVPAPVLGPRKMEEASQSQAVSTLHLPESQRQAPVLESQKRWKRPVSHRRMQHYTSLEASVRPQCWSPRKMEETSQSQAVCDITPPWASIRGLILPRIGRFQ